MFPSDSPPIARFLLRWGAEESECLDELVKPVEHELRRIAHGLMRGVRQGQTLQTTAPVNEASLKLVDLSLATGHDRATFAGVAAMLMRSILVDNKRGRAVAHLLLDEGPVFSPRQIGGADRAGRCIGGSSQDGSEQGASGRPAVPQGIEHGATCGSATRPPQHRHSRPGPGDANGSNAS
jgi:hypothetical protein